MGLRQNLLTPAQSLNPGEKCSIFNGKRGPAGDKSPQEDHHTAAARALVGGRNEADDPGFFLHLLDDLADLIGRQTRLGKTNAVETAA